MADQRFTPKTNNPVDCMNHLVEELGEVAAALGKTLRHGVDSVNPLLPPSHQERNGDWLLREMEDLSSAIIRTRHAILVSGFMPKVNEETDH